MRLVPCLTARARRILPALVALLALTALAKRAEAYPQFQFSTDNSSCTLCHYAPAGGGLINGWGRSEAADTISRGGDGEFLHGLWEPPDFLDIGGDFRGVVGAHDTESTGIDPLIFPMQADIYTRFDFGSVKLLATIGARGSARPRDPPPHTRVLPRELYLMYQPDSKGLYVRAGRFMAPYGLRQVDHTNYVRRDLGFYAWEETLGVSGGYLKNDWELHVTAHTRDPLIKVGMPGHGITAMYEKRISENTAAWGAQTKIQLGPDSMQYWAGGMFKKWFEGIDLLLLSEANLGVRDVDTAGADPILQGIAHLNLTYFLLDGVMLGTTLEAKHSDFTLRGKDAEAAYFSVQYFPRAHFELMLYTKAQRTRQTHDLTTFLMFHYYL